MAVRGAIMHSANGIQTRKAADVSTGFAHDRDARRGVRRVLSSVDRGAFIPIPSVVSRLSRLASVALFVLLSLFLVWFGSVYLGAGDYLSFHAAAVPEEAHDAGRPLYLALTNLVGSASLSLGAAGGFLALGAIRRGELAATGSPTSWHIMGGLIGTTLTAAALGLAGRRGREDR